MHTCIGIISMIHVDFFLNTCIKLMNKLITRVICMFMVSDYANTLLCVAVCVWYQIMLILCCVCVWGGGGTCVDIYNIFCILGL